MQKILFIDPEKCRGCRLCEIVCSMHHENVCNPSVARIHVVKGQIDGFYVPITMKCDLCNGNPTCVKFCVPNALQFIDATADNLRKKRVAVESFLELMQKFRKSRRIKAS